MTTPEESLAADEHNEFEWPPADAIMAGAARAFYESSVIPSRAHEREYNRLAFFMVVAFMSEPNPDLRTRMRGPAFMDNINRHYEQVWGDVSPYRSRTDAEMTALLDFAMDHFDISKEILESDKEVIALSILRRRPGVTFRPDRLDDRDVVPGRPLPDDTPSGQS